MAEMIDGRNDQATPRVII